MYQERFNDAAFVSTAYAQRLRTMVRTICRKHGLAERSSDALLTRETGGADQGRPQQGVLFDAPLRRPAAAVRTKTQRVMMVS